MVACTATKLRGAYRRIFIPDLVTASLARWVLPILASRRRCPAWGFYLILTTTTSFFSHVTGSPFRYCGTPETGVLSSYSTYFNP